MNTKIKGREEFEQSSAKKIKSVVSKAKEIRNQAKTLENTISDKNEIIRNYQNILENLGQELVKIQVKLYADGTT